MRFEFGGEDVQDVVAIYIDNARRLFCDMLWVCCQEEFNVRFEFWGEDMPDIDTIYIDNAKFFSGHFFLYAARRSLMCNLSLGAKICQILLPFTLTMPIFFLYAARRSLMCDLSLGAKMCKILLIFTLIMPKEPLMLIWLSIRKGKQGLKRIGCDIHTYIHTYICIHVNINVHKHMYIYI